VVAQAVGGAVVPHKDVGGPFPDRADRVGEAHGRLIGETLHDAASGEAQELGVHGLEDFHEVFAHAVAVVGIGGHEGREAELDFTAEAGFQDQARVLVVFDGDEGGVIPAEAGRGHGEICLAVYFARFAFQGYGDFHRSADRLGEHVEVVDLTLFLGHTGETDVVDLSLWGEFHIQGDKALGVELVLPVQGHLRAVCVPGGDGGVGNVILADPAGQTFAVIELIFPAQRGDKGYAFLVHGTTFRGDGILKGTVA